MRKQTDLVKQDLSCPILTLVCLCITSRLIYSKLQINRASQYGVATAGKRWNIFLNKSDRIPSSLPRSVGVACYHLLTGHDYLQRHLHCIGVKDSACCPLCHYGEMDGDHLRHCPIVLKNFVDNSMLASFNTFFFFHHHFIGLLAD
ncbi:putative gag-pol polyprotein [Trichonephila clavipes]|nr:putative gag-pol polyprotein [Trichonephila clavipes]